MKNEEETLLSIETAAELLEVATQTVRKAITEGSLKAYKRFGRWYIFRSDVLDYIRSGECSNDRSTDHKNKSVK